MSRLAYKVTADDLAELSLYRLRSDPRLRLQMQALRFAVPLVILLATLGTVYLLDSDRQLQPIDWLVPCALAIGMVVIFPRTFASNMRRRLAAQYKEGPSKDLVGAYAATISAERISVQTARGSEVGAPWSAIGRVAVSDSYIFLVADDTTAIVMPRQGFAKAEQYEQAKELVRQYWPGADSNKALTPR